jgi:hypothetical protein
VRSRLLCVGRVEECALGRVLFTPEVEPTKAGPAKAEPAIDWSENRPARAGSTRSLRNAVIAVSHSNQPILNICVKPIAGQRYGQPSRDYSITTRNAAAASSPMETSSMTVTQMREIAIIDRGVDDLATLLVASAPMLSRYTPSNQLTQRAIMPILRICKPAMRETTEAMSE